MMRALRSQLRRAARARRRPTRAVFGLDGRCELPGYVRQLLISARDLEHVLACRHRAQSRYRLVKPSPEVLWATSSGARPQLIRWLAIGLACRRPLKSLSICCPADTRRLARALG